MDPNEALANIRTALKAEREIRAADSPSEMVLIMLQYDLPDLVECVEVLDDWLSKGGFLPDDWKKNDEVVA